MQRLSKGLAVTSAAGQAIYFGMRKDPVSFWDIGARWGLSRSMQALYRVGVIRPTFFDPDPSEADRLAQAYRHCTVFPFALWDRDGIATLNITQEPGGSSLLRPIDMQVVRTEPVPTKRADTLLAGSESHPEIIKLDVQGAELAVLDGFGRLLPKVVCIEAEVSFQRQYNAQPLLEDVTGFLMAHGFGLFDVQPFGVRSTRAAVQANAFFVRRALQTEREAAVERMFRTVNRIDLVH